MVTVSLVTQSGLPHWHELWGTTAIKFDPQNPLIQFKNLSVMMDKSKKMKFHKSKMERRVVRLQFVMQFEHASQSYYGQCLTEPIYNERFLINKISRTQGSMAGGDEVIILCSRIRKAKTNLRITEDKLNPNIRCDPEIDIGNGLRWIRDCESDLFFIDLPNSSLSFHHQFAIYFEMPPYYDQVSSKQARVRIQIIDIEDQVESTGVYYTYLSKSGK
jgi:hypothetical protein